jgi:hypothetical protein
MPRWCMVSATANATSAVFPPLLLTTSKLATPATSAPYSASRAA